MESHAENTPRVIDLLVVGELNADVIVDCRTVEPRYGQVESLVEDAALVLGSSGAITACGAARLGARVAMIGVVGDDWLGTFVLERLVDVPPSLVWECWTTPRHSKKWFTPAPWKTVECEIDLRPGGIFYTVMESPEGQKFPNTGCYLEVVKNERLTWTNALLPAYRGRPDVYHALAHVRFLRGEHGGHVVRGRLHVLSTVVKLVGFVDGGQEQQLVNVAFGSHAGDL